MENIKQIAYVVKRSDGDSERMILLDSWETVSDVLSKLDGTSDSIHIYRCEIQSTKK